MSSDDNNFEESESRISKFNSTIAILYRLDILWKDAHNHSRMGQLMKWNWDLDRVWCELAAEAKLEEEKSFASFSSEISKVKNNSETLYKTLLRKEIFLRKVLQKQGKGIEYRQTNEEYMSD